MSASSKKKLRHAQEAEKMTEKQLTEQKEAKKLKTYSIIFAVVIALMVVFAVYTAVTNTISHSGVRERNTTALTVGNHEVSNAELNFYFIDAVNNFYSTYGSYAAMFGLDVTKPLDEQVISEETGSTWADDFMTSAKENVKAVYALNDAAAEAGYTLSADQLTNIDLTIANISAYATMYGYSNAEDYIKAMYGNGANEELLREYITMTTLAGEYQNHYAENLVYEDADLRAAEAENYAQYSAFSYNSYYLSTGKFLTGGTEDDNGTVTYSDEEKEAARAAAEGTAKLLAQEENNTVEKLDAAIAGLEINAETEGAASTAYINNSYSGINTTILDWVTDEARQAGEITYIESASTTTDEEGKETTTVNGYYVVLFNGSDDNNFPLVNVRHILIPFEGGSYNSSTNTTTYSDEQKAAAKAKAEEVLGAWEAGDATEDSFAALANEKSADSDGTDGGLYTDVYPGQMVENFDIWCFTEGRKTGDTGIVESPYGYHVMFYSGDSETLYRDFIIENDLMTEDTNAWYTALVDSYTVTEVDTKYVNTSLVLASN